MNTNLGNSNIIVSNTPVNQQDHPYAELISFNEFLRRASDEEDGLNVEDLLYVNVDDIDQDTYEEIKSVDFVRFFTLNNVVPPFINLQVEYWGNKNNFNNNINSDNTFNQNNISEMHNNENYEVSQPTTINDFIAEQTITSANGQMEDLMVDRLNNLFDDASGANNYENEEPKNAKIYVFGSSKGGTGKTFTSIISTYRYAMTHPDQRIALVDFDIIDGQVGISIHKYKPTMRNYYTQYKKGLQDFRTMKEFAIKGNDRYPSNVDFYLAPTSETTIKNDAFWINVIQNVIQHYDVVVFDTGIDYLHINPISYAYKIADKILIVTTTSIKSVTSVKKQISCLKGEIKNNVFSPEDDLASRINLIVTQVMSDDPMNGVVLNTLRKQAEVIAVFGTINENIHRAEYYGEWDVFDNNKLFNQYVDEIMA